MIKMNYSSLAYIGIGIAILILIIYNQMRVRQVYRKIKITVPIIFIILGIFTLSEYFQTQIITTKAIISIIISLTALAVGMGVLRAKTMKLWADDAHIYRQGNWLTILLWVITFSLHLFLDYYGNTGESTILIYLGITLIIQRWIIQNRAINKFSNFLLNQDR